MSRIVLLILIVLNLPVCGFCQEQATVGEREASGVVSRKVGERFDAAKISQLREKLNNSRLDMSKLKKMTWKIGDDTREALVYIPASNGQKMPLVFAFHGHGGRSEHVARRLALHECWPEAVCVYPLGLPTPAPLIDPEGKRSGWQKSIGDQHDRDLLFFDSMLKTLTSENPIDASRVYSTGHSNGGFFTYVLWAARGDTLAAIAPIAALNDLRDFKLQKPKPVLHIAGEQDPIVKFRSQERTMEQIRSINGCDPVGKAAGQGGTEYDSANGPTVVTYIHPGGHEIPDDAGQRIAKFFQSQQAR